MKVPAENRSAKPMLSLVAKEVSFNIKKVKMDAIGEARAKEKRYIFDFEAGIFICFKNENSPNAAGPLWSIIATNTTNPVSVLLETEAPTAMPSTIA